MVGRLNAHCGTLNIEFSDEFTIVAQSLPRHLCRQGQQQDMGRRRHTARRPPFSAPAVNVHSSSSTSAQAIILAVPARAKSRPPPRYRRVVPSTKRTARSYYWNQLLKPHPPIRPTHRQQPGTRPRAFRQLAHTKNLGHTHSRE